MSDGFVTTRDIAGQKHFNRENRMSKANRQHAILSPSIAFCVALVAGCAGNPGPNAPSGGASSQVAQGQSLFGDRCASCHGSGGEGVVGKAPPVVGKAALPLDPPPGAKKRKVQFHTAADVFAWVKVNMPGDAPGSLTDEQYAAVMAFDLKANGVDLTGKTVDATTAPTIVLHP
jgi:mono/diheme cytochrome c family protein